MANYDYDVITVGGGLGGSALAKVLAENGLRVLVIERERQFKDRIRGEWMAPWGVAEAQNLGLYDTLLERCGHETPFFDTIGMGPARDLRTTTPQQLPSLTFYHCAMQEVLIEVARNAGAVVWRGASVCDVRLGHGHPAIATVELDGAVRELSARLVVSADGRSSNGRTWGAFEAHRGKQRLLGAGVMFENMFVQEDKNLLVMLPGVQRAALLFPQGRGRVRSYIVYGPHEIGRLQGMGDADRFVEECVRTGIPRDSFTGVRAVGPLATFDMTESWIDNPYRDGFALIGDAAASTDPTWGQGLSLTLRDVRVLSEKLIANPDWEMAARTYAAEHEHYLKSMLTAHGWLFDFFFDLGPEAAARRARALPLLMHEPERAPDHNFSGPEMPSDENARRRFFADD